jgi:hypothetical protein
MVRLQAAIGCNCEQLGALFTPPATLQLHMAAVYQTSVTLLTSSQLHRQAAARLGSVVSAAAPEAQCVLLSCSAAQAKTSKPNSGSHCGGVAQHEPVCATSCTISSGSHMSHHSLAPSVAPRCAVVNPDQGWLADVAPRQVPLWPAHCAGARQPQVTVVALGTIL